MEAYINVNPDEFQRFKAEVGDAPITMLNLLKYKDLVEETGQTGKEGYSAYLNAASPFLESVNAKVLFFGSPKHMLIGPMDEALWDAVIIVQYNSFSDFFKMVNSEGYPSHLRAQALQDSRLIHCKSIQ
ncbi:hypothetical protein [Croceivirga thetidis]|uniref:DUF1330 domain-containing protein n=1 Tax=Croceivirga thetidis TaxID=2721623 RepID=A0ABX1GS68_9FLAO|nr:hypothetical protein [Croceivirga thetidis]NKI32776.1 hypothetical protein [Croceivirga thetidis]